MNNIKRIISILLCFMLVGIYVPTSVGATTVADINWIAMGDTTNSTTRPIPDGYGTYFTGVSGENTRYWGYRVNIGRNASLTYEVPVATSGVYELRAECTSANTTVNVSVNGVDKIVGAPVNMGTWGPAVTDLQVISLGTLELDATTGGDTHTIVVTNKAKNAVCFGYFILSYVAPSEIESVTANGETLAEEAPVVKRGSDLFTIDVSRALNTDLTNAVVTLTEDGGEDITVAYAVDSTDASKFNIRLKETLAYEGNYTLSVSGLTDIYGYPVSKTLSFTTPADSEADLSGITSAEITEANDIFNGSTLVIKGVLENSSGDVIKGRKGTLTITDPNTNPVITLDDFSDDNGIVEFSHTLDAATALGGNYSLSLTAEYASAPDTDTVLYVSDTLRSTILGYLKDTTGGYDSDTTNMYAVSNVFDSYETELGLDLTQLSGLPNNANSFYTWFIAKDYETSGGLDGFKKDFAAYLALEELDVASDAADAESILSADALTALEISDDAKGRVALLTDTAPVNAKTGFYQAMADLTRPASLAELKTAYEDNAKKYLAIEKGKTDITLTGSNASVYVSQLAEIALSGNAATDLDSYVLTVACPSADVANALSYVMSGNETVTKSVSGTNAVFTVKELTSGTTDYGTLKYTPSSAGSTALTMSGDAVYKVDGLAYDIEMDVPSLSVSITASKNSNKPTYSSSSSSFGGSAPVKKPDVTNPEENIGGEGANNSSEPFTDIKDIEWAEESIMTLYKLGIISDSEDRNFRPNDSISRAEFIKMVVVALGIDDADAKALFNDVSKDEWFYSFVANAAEYGLITGDEKNNFNPYNEISRQDICVILSRVMDKYGYPQDEYASVFTDDGNISDYAKNAVYRLHAFKIINGMGDGTFMPQNMATRAQVAKMLEGFLRGVNIL